MIDYTLARKLKEAGFPQRKANGTGSWPQYTGYGTGFVYQAEENEPECYAPTLGELIEAIGDDFHCLVYTTNGGMDSDRKFWSAGTSRYVKDWQNGSTPDEAVANLWLALHPSE